MKWVDGEGDDLTEVNEDTVSLKLRSSDRLKVVLLEVEVLLV